jgi:hypothetical protein
MARHARGLRFALRLPPRREAEDGREADQRARERAKDVLPGSYHS